MATIWSNTKKFIELLYLPQKKEKNENISVNDIDNTDCR